MIAAWYGITLIISLSSLFLMSFTIYDLTVVMRDPFSDPAKRVGRYILLASGLSTIITALGFYLSSLKQTRFSDFNFVLYSSVGMGNMVFALCTMLWLLKRFRAPGMSPELNRRIRRRYLELVVLYTIFSWPICYNGMPSYTYEHQLDAHMGGTRFVTNWYLAFTLLSGLIISITRLRDDLFYEKMQRIWYTVTR